MLQSENKNTVEQELGLGWAVPDEGAGLLILCSRGSTPSPLPVRLTPPSFARYAVIRFNQYFKVKPQVSALEMPK